MLIKSRTEVYPELERLVKSQHSYEVPEVLALQVQAGLAKYLDWLCEVTSSDMRAHESPGKSGSPEK